LQRSALQCRLCFAILQLQKLSTFSLLTFISEKPILSSSCLVLIFRTYPRFTIWSGNSGAIICTECVPVSAARIQWLRVHEGLKIMRCSAGVTLLPFIHALSAICQLIKSMKIPSIFSNEKRVRFGKSPFCQ